MEYVFLESIISISCILNDAWIYHPLRKDNKHKKEPFPFKNVHQHLCVLNPLLSGRILLQFKTHVPPCSASSSSVTLGNRNSLNTFRFVLWAAGGQFKRPPTLCRHTTVDGCPWSSVRVIIVVYKRRNGLSLLTTEEEFQVTWRKWECEKCSCHFKWNTLNRLPLGTSHPCPLLFSHTHYRD